MYIKTLDGEFVCIHGVNGKFCGQVECIDGITDVFELKISSVTLTYI